MAALVYGAAQQPKEGNPVCGDAVLVCERAGGHLVVVADGLGSGPAAREASDRAIQYVEAHPDLPLERLLEGCHSELQPTRGAAVGLLAVDREAGEVSFAGLGNIEVRSRNDCRFKPISTNGIVGANYRKPRLYQQVYQPGELLVVHSDGLRTSFDLDLELQRGYRNPSGFARRLLELHGRDNDDVTVVVVELPTRE